MRFLLLVPAWSMWGCGNDIGVAKGSVCNGETEGDEVTVDAPFDADEDGFFDGANPDCVSTYGADQLDCDDGDAAVNPAAGEAQCDGLDNDCDAGTEDAADADEDGINLCTDCDDQNSDVRPGAVEISCNAVDDDCDVATPDSVDSDADGFDSCTDCDDNRSSVRPGAEEVTCNDIDDDCDASTSDRPDEDGDGSNVCVDCDDSQPTVHPGLSEVCDDGLDNDCNGEADDGCIVDYSGTWTMDSAVTYTCARGNVDFDFERWDLFDTNPTLTATSNGSSQPGTLTGSFSSGTTFRVTRTLTGTCQEDYILQGSFTGPDTFEATFQAQYTPSRSGACLDCTAQSWDVTGTR